MEYGKEARMKERREKRRKRRQDGKEKRNGGNERGREWEEGREGCEGGKKGKRAKILVLKQSKLSVFPNEDSVARCSGESSERQRKQPVELPPPPSTEVPEGKGLPLLLMLSSIPLNSKTFLSVNLSSFPVHWLLAPTLDLG